MSVSMVSTDKGSSSPKAGIKDLRIHDLRHFAATMLSWTNSGYHHPRNDWPYFRCYGTVQAPGLEFVNQSGERIGGRISKQIATNSATPTPK